MSAPTATINAPHIPAPTTGGGVARDKKNGQGRGRPKADQPKGGAISTRLEPEWQAVWEAFLESCDPPTTEAAAVRQAIKQYLTARGFVPPKKNGAS